MLLVDGNHGQLLADKGANWLVSGGSNSMFHTGVLADEGSHLTTSGKLSSVVSDVKSMARLEVDTIGDVSFTATNVDHGGTLQVDGKLTGTSVQLNRRLEGTGTVSSAVVGTSTGVIAPGNSIGTLTVTGPISFTSGSQLEIEVDPTAWVHGSFRGVSLHLLKPLFHCGTQGVYQLQLPRSTLHSGVWSDRLYRKDFFRIC